MLLRRASSTSGRPTPRSCPAKTLTLKACKAIVYTVLIPRGLDQLRTSRLRFEEMGNKMLRRDGLLRSRLVRQSMLATALALPGLGRSIIRRGRSRS